MFLFSKKKKKALALTQLQLCSLLTLHLCTEADRVGEDMKHRLRCHGVDTHMDTSWGGDTHTHTEEWVVILKIPACVGENGMKNLVLPSALV